MKQQNDIPNWLRKTQNNSWEPEIFISGIVLYGLIQIPQYLEEFRYFFKREIYGFSNNIDNLVAILSTSVQWLIFGLILHLFFRGIWIGLVGLSYVFPDGVNNDRLKYKGKFHTRIMTIPHFSDQIIRLEKISSSIFSVSYFIFMSIIGAYIFLFVSIIVPVYFFIYVSGYSIGDLPDHPNLVNGINTFGLLMLVMGLIYLFDFLTLGLLRKIKWVNRVYYPIYKYVSTLTLSFLYRNVYYILISNFTRWKVIVFIIIFIGITMTLFNMNASSLTFSNTLSRLEFYGKSDENFVRGSSYTNMSPKKKDQRVTIQSDIIKDNVLRVFISHNIAFEDSIKASCDYKVLNTNNSMDSLKLVCMGNFYQVLINDSLYSKPEWLFHYDNSTEHHGIMSYVNISHLNTGMHRLNIQTKKWPRKNYAFVPFYKE